MSRVVAAPVRLPRPLHPGAWWIWALGLATAASRTTNPLLLLVVIGVLCLVVARRRGDAPWARGFHVFLVLGAIVIAIRVVFRILLGGGDGGDVLFTLPEIVLPEVAAGIRIGGPVSAQALLSAVYDGLRLAALLCCVGAATVLADPRRMLRSMPSALYQLGTAVTVALTVAPQLVESGVRVHRARRLRAGAGSKQRRRRLVRGVLLPVLVDALDRSLLLAAGMDARGYGRSNDVPVRVRRTTSALLLASTMGICAGTYGILDGTAPPAFGVPMLLLGAGVGALGIGLAGRRIVRSRYRPDPWRGPEWTVVGCAVITVAVLAAGPGIDPAELYPSLWPLTWPPLPPVALAAVLVSALPAWLAPPTSLPPMPARSASPTPAMEMHS